MHKGNIWFIGDIQFSNLKDWSAEVNHKIIEYLKNFDFGEDAEIVQLGDVVEKSCNYGVITKTVFELFAALSKKAKHIYIICGNHDHKFINGGSDYFVQFLDYFENITVIKNELEIETPNGFKWLALPYKRVKNSTLTEYYSKDLPPEFYKTKYDFIAGHVEAKCENSFTSGVDFDRFSTKNIILGHIHTRVGKLARYYPGSIVPLKINEEVTDLPRCLMKYDGTKLEEIEIPIFVRYKTIKYGDEIKNDNSATTIYTVDDCALISEAKEKYKGSYIRNIVRKISDKNIKKVEKKLFMDNKEALSFMIKENNISISEQTLSFLNKLLG